MYIEQQEIYYKIDNNNFTAKIMPSNNIEQDIIIPRLINFENKQYKITEISEESFRNTHINSLMFTNDSLICSIPKYAFSYSAIQRLHLPNSIGKLDDGWCHHTPNLVEITISKNNKFFQISNDGQLLLGKSKMEDEVYDIIYFSKRNIKNATIPSTIKQIKAYSFEFCEKLQTVEFLEESKLEEICDHAFSHSTLNTIKIPKHVKVIGNKSFYFCSDIISFNFEDKSELESVGVDAFAESPALYIIMQSLIWSKYPLKYESQKNAINDIVFKNIYSKFSFKYLIFNDETYTQNHEQNLLLCLILYLSQFKFITFHFPDNKSNDCIFCVEGECIIFQQIEESFIMKIINHLKKNQISLINIKCKSRISNKSFDDLIIDKCEDEVNAFCDDPKIRQIIKSNDFIKITIYAIIGYLIRRFYYPSDYFDDSSFFNFDHSIVNIENNIKKYIFSNSSDDIFDEIKNQIKTTNDNNTKTMNKFDIESKAITKNNFSKHFIILRKIGNFDLIFHLQKIHLFFLKKFDDEKTNEITREMKFVQHQHRCFTKFYWFYKENKKINGFIYEFCTNESLDSFIKNNNNLINEILLLTNISRIFEGINYLHINKLIHRDLKPLNILVDHDGLAYISDFETIRSVDSDDCFTNDIGSISYTSPEQDKGENLSYPTDIYSFGLIIYYMYAKKDMLQIGNYLNKEGNIKVLSNVSNNIKYLYENCVQYEQDKRLKSEEIKAILNNEFNSFNYIEQYSIDNKNRFTDAHIINFIFEKIINQQTEDSLSSCKKQIEYFKTITLMKSQKNKSSLYLYLGNIYENGHEIEQNYSKAIEYYEKSAKLNNSEALNNLGLIYENGNGVEQKYSKAIEYYKKSAKFNNPEALNNLGILYENGLGVQNNYVKAMECYDMSVKLNNQDAQLLKELLRNHIQILKGNNSLANLSNNLILGIQCEYGILVKKDLNKAIEYYKKSAKFNNPEALLHLGYFYENGIGVEQDYEKAKDYYERAANLGNSYALLSLGIIYKNGNGVKRDLSKMTYYYEKSAELNNSDALNNLATLYAQGIGVKQDFQKAIDYYEKSAKLNNSYALFNLGLIYENGKSVVKDILKAKVYYEKSANFGNTYGLFLLGLLYEKGRGVDKDYNKARTYYLESAKYNNSYSCLCLGHLYENGLGVKKNYFEAQKYYWKSAFLDNSDAYNCLASLYKNGLGVEQNHTIAKLLYEKSTELNNQYALYYLGNFYSNNDEYEVDFTKAVKFYQRCSNIEYGFIKKYQRINGMNTNFFESNEYRYISFNDLGLIYLIEFEDYEKAEFNIKESAFNEYPFGQNNYGLYTQFYYRKKENAEYMFKRSSKHNFSLAEFNLGQLLESDKKIDEAMKYYIFASEHDDEKLIYRNITIQDKRLEISKTFIICFTNLKLTEYYLSKGDYNESAKYFIRSLKNIKSENSDYQFKFKLRIIDEIYEEYPDDTFLYLKKFILNFPLFNLVNQPNLDLNRYSYIFQQSNDETQFKNDKQMKYETKQIFDLKKFKNHEVKVNTNEKVFENPAELFEIITSNSKLMKTFSNEIREIIHIMKEILYTPPYLILFGRISILKPKPKEDDKRKEIDINFYNGFGY